MKMLNIEKLAANLFGAFCAKIMKIQIFCCQKRPNKFLENQKEFSSKIKLIKIK
jgi:hypothetical protein